MDQYLFGGKDPQRFSPDHLPLARKVRRHDPKRTGGDESSARREPPAATCGRSIELASGRYQGDCQMKMVSLAAKAGRPSRGPDEKKDKASRFGKAFLNLGSGVLQVEDVPGGT